MLIKPCAVLYFILSFISSINILNGEVRYVSKTGGVPTPPYTSWATACDSLQKCFDFCQSGDTIYVNRGIYKETVYVKDKNLTIIGIDTDECIIDGTGIEGKLSRYIMCEFKNNIITLKNMTLKFKRVDNYEFYYAFLNDGISNITNCIIDSTCYCLGLLDKSVVSSNIMKNANIAIDVIAAANPSIELDNNCFYILSNIPFSSVIINGAGGGKYKIYNNIMIKDSEELGYYGIILLTNGRVEIKNNMFCRLRTAIQESSFQSGTKDTTFIINNTMVYCKSNGIMTGNLPKERIIKNNIFAYGKRGIYSYNAEPVTADYNLFYKIWATPHYYVTPGEHDIIADPMFNNDTIATLEGLYDYRLQKFSPAIDAGDPNILDIDGTRSDIGMFGGPLGLSYVYKDLAPKQIKYITAKYQPDTNRIKLLWEKRWEADFKEYKLYKDINPNFIIDSTKLIAKLTDTLYYDILTKGTQKV